MSNRLGCSPELLHVVKCCVPDAQVVKIGEPHKRGGSARKRKRPVVRQLSVTMTVARRKPDLDRESMKKVVGTEVARG